MKKSLYIYGAGGLGREVLSWLPLLADWEPAGFIDDTAIPGSYVKGLPVIGGKGVLGQMEMPNVVLAIGNPFTKKMIVQQLQNINITYPVLIHPSVIFGDQQTIMIGDGCVLAAGSILTTDIRMGTHVLINLNCTIGHDTSIGDFSSFMCGINIAGEVHIGESVLVGSGANIRNRIHVGHGSVVGMGAAVIRDVAPETVVVGVPAKTMNP